MISLIKKGRKTEYKDMSFSKFWQFGKLEADTFIRNKNFYSIQEIEHLFAAVNFIFQDCDRQLTSVQ